MAIEIVKASIFTTGAKYILHQTNCVSYNSAGLAKNIFDTYPYSNYYKNRKEYDSTTYSEPGTIQICGDGLKERYIINMFAQYNPGPTNEEALHDNIKDRKKWFFSCLMKVAEIKDLNSVALPDRIGCGLAGGDWSWYFKKILAFEKYVERKAKVLIYKNET